jgi:hypothetical protein
MHSKLGATAAVLILCAIGLPTAVAYTLYDWQGTRTLGCSRTARRDRLTGCVERGRTAVIEER